MTVVDFFFDFFSTSFDDLNFFDSSEEGYWARCFGKAFWVVRGGPGGHLGASGGGLGGVLGGPGVVRRGPGDVLGGSWALLGRSWSDL